MAFAPLQTARQPLVSAVFDRIEGWLEAERGQLPLWLPVMLGLGIAGWFVLPDRPSWIALIAAALALALTGIGVGQGRRAGRALTVGGIAVALGCALVWARAEWAAAPVLQRTVVASFTADVLQVQQYAAKDSVRALVHPLDAPDLPPRMRVTIANADAPKGLAKGDRLKLRARLLPPQGPVLPGGYDFRMTAWFQGLGATGKAFAPVERMSSAPDGGSLRDRLSAHIRASLPAGEAGIAVALVTGDQGSVTQADADAMRRSGLAHLLSVSGLHITAAVAAAMLIAMRLLALSPKLALRWPLMLIAAAFGAATGIGYTLLSGAEVPTIRSCIATLLVLAGLALGREAMTLRLVAAGALVVLLLWPEALIGPSFQLSFAAVVAVVTLHEHPRMHDLFAKRDEGPVRGYARAALALLLSGIAVELALAPIALYHFHKEGLYGAAANIVAIPLTTFAVMPLEVLALLFDLVGLGAPFWWATDKAIALLLWIAHHAGSSPGAVAMLPGMPRGAFALMVAGGLWLCLWRGKVRWAGLLPFAIGGAWALAVPAPDLLVTGDGRHLAVRADNGRYALLRPRAGDYIRGVLGENAGVGDALDELDALPGAVCGRDSCAIDLDRNGRRWRLLATRSPYLPPLDAMQSACAAADIAVSDRRLPRTCRPKWLKLDKPMLAKSGGVTIVLGSAVRMTNVAGDQHPWTVAVSAPEANRTFGIRDSAERNRWKRQ